MKVYRNIILNEIEFIILQNAFGKEKPIVVFDSARKAMSQEEYNQGLFSLTKKGIVDGYDEEVKAFMTYGEVADLFDIINMSDEVYRFVPSDTNAVEYIMYHDGNSVVFATPGSNESEYIKLMKSDVREAIKIICDAYVSDIIDTSYPLEEDFHLEGDESEDLASVLKIEILNSKTGEETYSISIVETPLKYIIAIGKKDVNLDEIVCRDYTQKRFEQLLLDILEGDDDIG